MTFLRAAPFVMGVTLMSALLAPGVKADEHDKKTTVTFSGPVEIPPVYVTGMRVLPAGTYVFKLMNSDSNRHIVQIFNQDQTKIYATILAIPNYRLKATGETSMTFYEGLRGQPEAIRAWFYPGANWGEEFVYPQAKAVELAKVTNQPVLAVVADVKEEVAKPDEPAVVVTLQQLPIKAVQPTGEIVELAQVVQSAPPATVAQVREAPVSAAAAQVPAQTKTLPATASFLPLIGIGGLLALGCAVTLLVASKRVL